MSGAPGMELDDRSPEPARAPAASSVRKVFTFLLTGGIAALVNVVSRFLLTPVTGFEASVVLAYLLGMVTAFTLFRIYVFGPSSRSIGSESYRFVVVNLGALALVFAISTCLARLVFPAIGFTWHAEDIAHLIGVAFPALTSYVGHSRYTFRS
jgi:putative flippase GtrA